MFSVTVNNLNDLLYFTTVLQLIFMKMQLSYIHQLMMNAGVTIAITTYSIPDWVTFNTTTYELSGVPTNNNVGTHNIVILASSEGDTVTQSYDLTVTNENDVPTFLSTAEITATEDVQYSYLVETEDIDADEM